MAQTQLAAQRFGSLSLRKKALESLLKRSLSAEQKSAVQAKLNAINTRLASPAQTKAGQEATAASVSAASGESKRHQAAAETRGVLEQRFGPNWRKRVYGSDYKPGKVSGAYKLSQQQRASQERLSGLRRQERQLGATGNDALRSRLEKTITSLVERRTQRAGRVAGARKFLQASRGARQKAIQNMPGDWLKPGAKVPRAPAPKPRRRKRGQ